MAHKEKSHTARNLLQSLYLSMLLILQSTRFCKIAEKLKVESFVISFQVAENAVEWLFHQHAFVYVSKHKELEMK